MDIYRLDFNQPYHPYPFHIHRIKSFYIYIFMIRLVLSTRAEEYDYIYTLYSWCCVLGRRIMIIYTVGVECKGGEL